MSGFEIGFTAQSRATSLARLLQDLRGRAETAQTEAVTGRQADRATALSGRTEEATAIETRLTRIAQFGENIALAETRAETITRSIGSVRDGIGALANTADVALASQLAQGKATLPESARATLGQAISALNVTIGGRTLFAGDSPDRAALAGADAFLAVGASAAAGLADAASIYAAIDTAFSAPGGAFEATLYTGGAGAAPRASIGDGEVVNFSVKADDAALRSALRDATILSLAYDPSLTLDEGEREALSRMAIAGLRRANDDLAEVAGRIGTVEERIGTVKARNTAEEAALSLALNELTASDPYQAAVELRSVEGSIETLFATTARLSALSLTNFIR